MHVHASQMNPNAALDAAYAAQKAAAKRDAAATRKKLTEFASELSGETDSFVARTGDEEPSREPTQQNRQDSSSGKHTQQQGMQADPEEAGSHLSNWA